MPQPTSILSTRGRKCHLIAKGFPFAYYRYYSQPNKTDPLQECTLCQDRIKLYEYSYYQCIALRKDFIIDADLPLPDLGVNHLVKALVKNLPFISPKNQLCLQKENKHEAHIIDLNHKYSGIPFRFNQVWFVFRLRPT